MGPTGRDGRGCGSTMRRAIDESRPGWLQRRPRASTAAQHGRSRAGGTGAAPATCMQQLSSYPTADVDVNDRKAGSGRCADRLSGEKKKSFKISSARRPLAQSTPKCLNLHLAKASLTLWTAPEMNFYFFLFFFFLLPFPCHFTLIITVS